MKNIKALTLGTLVSGVLLSGVGNLEADAAVHKHVVKQGDTLSKIAKKHHTTVDELLKQNKITNKDSIKVGQEIKYNDKKDSVRTVYTVKKNDTLYKIGKKFKVNYLTIMEKNNLTSTLIHVGDKLVVKGKPFDYVLEAQKESSVNTYVAPVQNKQVQTYVAPVQNKQVQTYKAPVQNKQVQTYVAPVQNKQVQTYKAPVQNKQVQTYQAPKQTTNALNTGGNSSVDAHLRVIMQRESGGNPRAVNPAGYYGLFQFSPQTWAAVGGKGNPANASVEEQWKRARILYTQYGAQHWSTAY